MQNRKAKLKQEDLVSGVAFKNWVKECIDLYQNNEIPDSHLLIYLNYIEEKVRKNDKIDQRIWLKTIKELKEKIEVVS